MKIRSEFVTNSSSSSFTIAKSNLTVEQIEKIKSHIKVASELNMRYVDPFESWDISETDDKITGFTLMDNFNMYLFLKLIGIDDNDVQWEDWS